MTLQVVLEHEDRLSGVCDITGSVGTRGQVVRAV